MRKITAAFSPPLRIFPQKIPPLRAYNGKNVVKTRSFAVLGSGTEIALALQRGEIESLFSLRCSLLPIPVGPRSTILDDVRR
jgi:hypothetical protein